MVKIWLYLAPPGLGWWFIQQQDNRNKSNANIPWSDASPESAVCMQCCSAAVAVWIITPMETLQTPDCLPAVLTTHIMLAVLQCLCQFLLSEGILVPERTFNMPFWQKRLWPLSIHNNAPECTIVSKLEKWVAATEQFTNYAFLISIYLVLVLTWSIIGSSLGRWDTGAV